MNCAYCNKSCDDRPVSYEAICWTCHNKAKAERAAPYSRKLRWWRRLRASEDTNVSAAEGEA